MCSYGWLATVFCRGRGIEFELINLFVVCEFPMLQFVCQVEKLLRKVYREFVRQSVSAWNNMAGLADLERLTSFYYSQLHCLLQWLDMLWHYPFDFTSIALATLNLDWNVHTRHFLIDFWMERRKRHSSKPKLASPFAYIRCHNLRSRETDEYAE